MSNSVNLQEIDQEQALNLSRFFLKLNQNIILMGRRGIGKTHIAIQAAKDCGYKINYINLSVVERPDLAGYPNLHNDSDVVTYKSPYFLPLLAEGEQPNSIIIFDEIDKAPHDVTSPLLEILQFGTINGRRINSAGCILTGNLTSEGAHSNELSSALLDRGAKYILTFDFDKWIDWAKLNNVHDLILGFLSRSPEMVCGDTETMHMASPSPRGWTMASNALYMTKEMGMADEETVKNIISGFVGAEAGLKFDIWYRFYKKFEPLILSLVEQGSYPMDFKNFTLDEKYVFCITTCHTAKRKIIDSKTKSKQLYYAENIIKFFDFYQVEEEVQLLCMRTSFPFEFITKYKLYESKVFLEKSKTLQEETIKK